MRLLLRPLAAIVLTALFSGFAGAPAAHAEVGEVRFARNMGLGYLPLYVMEARKLVEKQAEAAGLGPLKTRYLAIGGPGAVNDALLSGNAEYGAAGLQGMIMVWDKTKGSINVRGLAALGAVDFTLNTNNPKIHRLEDFTDNDRIAVPTVGVSAQALVLERAAARIYGPDQYNHFDKLTVSLNHPTAVAALLAGKTEITGHFATPPYSTVELQDPKIHKVTNDVELLGQRSTGMSVWATQAFYQRNPKVNRAVLAALDEAIAIIHADPKGAAADFIAIEGGGEAITQDLVEKIITSNEVDYNTTPQGVAEWAQFMQSIGAIRNRPESWTELFFDAIHQRPGS